MSLMRPGKSASSGRWLKGATTTALGILFAACTVGPDYTPPAANVPGDWSTLLDAGLVGETQEPLQLARWWQQFNDPLLNKLVRQAIAANLDLRLADAQLRQARAQRNIAGSSRFPTIDAGGSAVRASGSENAGGGGGVTEVYSTQFDASWELDVFGGRRRATEAAAADLESSAEARRDVLITVVAEVALNYTELQTLQNQSDIANKNLQTQKQFREVVQSQYSAGAALQLDLDRAEANVASTRAELPRLQQQLLQSRNRLAVLLGEAPGTLDESDSGAVRELVPPASIVLGIPADVLRRRPDVRRAERRLAAETARVGVAVAELYPKFSLAGTIGLESLSMSSLINSNSSTFGIGPSVNWRIFDAGRTRAQIEVQNAVQEQALVSYESAVLKALEDVENAVIAFTQEQLRSVSLAKSVDAAASAERIATARYEAGASDFLSVLDAQRTLFLAQDKLAASRGTIVTNLIRLYKALGGGWDTTVP